MTGSCAAISTAIGTPPAFNPTGDIYLLPQFADDLADSENPDRIAFLRLVVILMTLDTSRSRALAFVVALAADRNRWQEHIGRLLARGRLVALRAVQWS